MSCSLVCLPFAGGGASFYRAWKQLSPVPGGLAVIPLQLPGREERFVEDPYTDAHCAAEELAQQLLAAVPGDTPFALFGHSLGAVLAYEVARRVAGPAGTRMRHLFVSGSPGPWSGRSQRATGLDDAGFLARVAEFAGFQHEALADPDMRELLLPVLRADVEMHENYKPVSDDPLPVPVTSLRGRDDQLVSRDQAGQWQAATSGSFNLVEVDGEHMYLVDAPLRLLEVVARELGTEPA